MEIPFIGGAYLDRSTNLNAQVCQNLYPVMDGQGGKKVLALYGTPGLFLFASPVVGEVRGLHVMGVYLYAVIGSAVYRLTTVGTATLMTGALNTTTGHCWIKDNGTQIMIVDGAHGYILSGTTVTEIADADFPVPSSLAYQDGYFIITKDASGRFYISDSYGGTAWDALDYATAEGYPDNLVTVLSSNRELWLLGEESYEVWYNSGDATFPFDRISGAINKVGCSAAASACEYQGTLVWLDHNRQVRQNNGYNSQVISTSQIDYQFGNYSTVSDAVGFIYTQDGHTFCVLTFPSHGKTWSYDFTTGFWHTRASDTTDLRHRANCHALFNNFNIVGDYQNGKLYKYDLAKYSDDGTALRRIRAAQTVFNERKNIFHHALEVEFEAGVGLAVNDPTLGTGTDPQAMLEFSDDGGHTWSNEKWTDIGLIGGYKTRAIWRRLGRSRNRVYKLTISDPVKVVIIGATLEATAGVS